MSGEDEFKFIFDRLLMESDEEQIEDNDDNEEPLMFSLEQSDESEAEAEGEDNGEVEVNNDWYDYITPHQPWVFDESNSGVDQLLLLGCTEPIHFYELFMTDIWDLIVNETNNYGREKNQLWETTTIEEIKRFIGLCLKMEIVRLPRLRDYWSSSPAFACHPIGSQVISRDRFEKLLSHLHFANNTNHSVHDNLYKISSVIELVNRNCKGVYRPGRNVCIEESLVPFKGRIEFGQYIQNKRHRYGVKMFKLRTRSGYTYSVAAYAGTDTSRSGTMDEAAVMRLMDGLLDEGRHVFTDNSYTSVSLAKRLLERKTHLIGMCTKNSKGLPKQVIQQRLKRGQVKAQQNTSGVMVLKWKDKKDIIMISTVHDATLCANTLRPQVIESYSQGKIFVDPREQMSSYSPYVRRTSKWYIRLFFHLVTQTCLVNAYRIYCENVRKITIHEFKAQVYMSLFEMDKIQLSTPSSGHILEDTGAESKKRRRCVGCYRKLSKCHDSKSAAIRTKQVRTRCSKCLRHFCLDCFNNVHRKCEF